MTRQTNTFTDASEIAKAMRTDPKVKRAMRALVRANIEANRTKFSTEVK